jgi:hypothetical protein
MMKRTCYIVNKQEQEYLLQAAAWSSIGQIKNNYLLMSFILVAVAVIFVNEFT